jgi:isopentenyl-diphosphate delta-isomerase
LVTLSGNNYLGLAYFGPRYIFGKTQDNFEVYIFNFSQDIYGKFLKVKLLKFLRAPVKVGNLTKLKEILQRDLHRLDQDVILVDKQDRILGIEFKIKAHTGQAKLHRAISIQLFNKQGELLIQQRSKYKRLFPLVWANTVCTDVRPYETYKMAAERRLLEEFGLSAALKPVFKFNYSAKWKDGSEREVDQAFFGRVVGQPNPDPKEIVSWKYISLAQAKSQLKDFAPWFQKILKKIKPSDIVIS